MSSSLERRAIEFAVPAGRQQVLVHMLDRGLGETGGEGHLREPERELGRQRDVVLALESEDLVHHVMRRLMVVRGEQAFHPQ